MSGKAGKDRAEEYKRVFELFDPKNEGTITTEKLGRMLRALGHKPTQSEIDLILKDIGAKANGTMTLQFKRFQELLSQKTSPDQEAKELMDAFQIFDKNNDGYITTSELRVVVSNLGVSMTDEEADDLIREVDTDGDGRISYDEFLEALRS